MIKFPKCLLILFISLNVASCNSYDAGATNNATSINPTTENGSTKQGPPISTALDSEEQAFLGLINAYRAQNNLGALSVSPLLVASSRWLSQDMGAKNYFSHTDSLGRDVFTRIKAFGYDYSTTEGENIAAGYADAQSTFTMWKNSAGHNANMLGANYKVIGIARANTSGSSYGWYWTTDFGGE